MKKIKLIYNPLSGDRMFKENLDAYIAALQGVGYVVHLFRLDENVIFNDMLGELGGYDALAVSGGDGTVNAVISAMLRNDIKTPLAIIPSGTANDFAAFLGLAKDPEALAASLYYENRIWADVGQVNDRYFINVCGAGLFTNVSQRVNENLKTTLGKLAYYLKSLEEIPSFQPLPVRITTSDQMLELDIFLFLALNTTGTGGFGKLAPKAHISDGLLDFVIVKSCSIMDLGKLFIKILRQQDFLSDPNILYFQDNFVKIQLLEHKPKYDISDVDGEYGPKLPLTIQAIPKKIPLIIPRGH
ncbi:MAG: YegS/Rv2252/BmrU family lipid kinase [Defluviitaleaceae bacterium]|nr:YegS/Rv2252/BmrU family lipid kinase [Defluviitaleaceae bacterium]